MPGEGADLEEDLRGDDAPGRGGVFGVEADEVGDGGAETLGVAGEVVEPPIRPAPRGEGAPEAPGGAGEDDGIGVESPVLVDHEARGGGLSEGAFVGSSQLRV